MALKREDIQHRGHRIIANKTGAMVYPDKYVIEADSLEKALKDAKEWVDTKYQSRHKDRRKPHIGTADDYAEAFDALTLGSHEEAMLKAHRNAPDRKLTAPDLANAAGWDGAGPANIHYGNLGRRVAEYLGLKLTDDDDRAWTEALAEYHEENSEWQLYEEAAEALDKLNLS
ncbi:hypothetical protein [Litorimonas haliclonae]|uniref:hypothetical protein n=1 Tax=Litorimonas haliclonae TaxID=2081977 RepID=UPI0039EE87E3